MKNKKGFTLIELLAVIVILAIIMVIAVPQILKVIENSRNNAAKSSMDLLKAGIQTQIASAELTNNPFTKDGDGCYTFDFDSKNNNYEKLEVKNKERFSGQVKYCNGEITDTNLAFDGNTGSSSSHTAKSTTLTNYPDIFSTNSANDNHSWSWISDNVIDTGMWEGDPAGFYYNQKIKVTSKTPATIKGKVSLWYNCGSNAKFLIGFSKENDINKDNFDAYQELNQTFSGGSVSEETYKNNAQDFEVTISEPGEYYIKSVYYMTSRSCSSYSRTYDMIITQ